jgi:hypothetical protein
VEGERVEVVALGRSMVYVADDQLGTIERRCHFAGSGRAAAPRNRPTS